VLATLLMLLELRCRLRVAAEPDPLRMLLDPEADAAGSLGLAVKELGPPVLVLLPLLLVSESGRSGTSSVCGSSVLPVEFVAGGDGRPEPVSLPPGLGGSGRSGIESLWMGGLV
jgi:hypothetical protein